MTKENTLGRKHKLNKRKWDDLRKRLQINIDAGRPIFFDQLKKVFPLLMWDDYINPSMLNLAIMQLESIGYKCNSHKGVFTKT